MSAILILTPLVSAAWPALSGAIVAAATACGFSLAAREGVRRAEAQIRGIEKGSGSGAQTDGVLLEIKNASIVGESLAQEEELAFEKDGVTVVFRKGLSGKVEASVRGEGKTEKDLLDIGTEVSRRAIQQFVKDRVLTQLKEKGFEVAEEQAEEGRTIRLTLRRWR